MPHCCSSFCVVMFLFEKLSHFHSSLWHIREISFNAWHNGAFILFRKCHVLLCVRENFKHVERGAWTIETQQNRTVSGWRTLPTTAISLIIVIGTQYIALGLRHWWPAYNYNKFKCKTRRIELAIVIFELLTHRFAHGTVGWTCLYDCVIIDKFIFGICIRKSSSAVYVSALVWKTPSFFEIYFAYYSIQTEALCALLWYTYNPLWKTYMLKVDTSFQ